MFHFHVVQICLILSNFRLFWIKGRKAEEQRAQRLASEYNQFRHEAERRIAEKDEEIEAIR